MATFAPHLADADVLHFINYKAAERTLSNGFSTSQTLTAIAGAYWHTAATAKATACVGRKSSFKAQCCERAHSARFESHAKYGLELGTTCDAAMQTMK